MHQDFRALIACLLCACSDEASAPPPPPAPSPGAEGTPSAPNAPPDDLGLGAIGEGNVPLFTHDLAAFGSGVATFTVRVGDDEVHRELRERAADGTLHVRANDRDVYLRGDAIYTVESGRCQTLAGELARPMSEAIAHFGTGTMAAAAYGVTFGGAPRNAARRAGTEADGTVRYTIDWTLGNAIASRRVTGEVWLDAQGRAVRSRGNSTAATIDGTPIPATAWEHAVTRIGEDVQVQIPEICAPVASAGGGGTGVGALPRLPGARVTLETGDRITYMAPGTMDDAVAFYRRTLGSAGYQVGAEQRVGTMGHIRATRAGQTVVVVVMGTDDGVSVILSPD